MKRGFSIIVFGIDIRTFSDQQFGQILTSQIGGDIKGSSANLAPGVDVSTIGQKSTDFFPKLLTGFTIYALE